jgi:hypothetical protein
MIDKRRGKTDHNSLISLFEKSEKIIALYKNHPGSVCRGTIFPHKTNQKMNDNLRIIAAKAGITKYLTSHCLFRKVNKGFSIIPVQTYVPCTYPKVSRPIFQN